MMLVIINADDLGLSKEINDAIFYLISAKLISSSTIMANAPFVEEAIRRARNYPEISFGIHLNITSLYPLSLANDLKPLLNKDGKFAGYSTLMSTSFTHSLSNAIYSEFCSQVEKLLSFGIRISHIDSHHHIHTIPRLFPIIKRIQKIFHIRRVRISRNIFLPSHRISTVLLLKKIIYNFMLKHYYSTRTTVGFGNLIEFYENVKRNNLKHKTIEIMIHVHPGTKIFKEEVKILKSFLYEQIPTRIQLINYYQL